MLLIKTWFAPNMAFALKWINILEGKHHVSERITSTNLNNWNVPIKFGFIVTWGEHKQYIHM